MPNRKLTRQQIDACRVILNDCDILLGASYGALYDAPGKRARLQAWADLCHYRKPKKAPRGSRLRYFHDMLQRRARATTIPNRIQQATTEQLDKAQFGHVLHKRPETQFN